MAEDSFSIQTWNSITKNIKQGWHKASSADFIHIYKSDLLLVPRPNPMSRKAKQSMLQFSSFTLFYASLTTRSWSTQHLKLKSFQSLLRLDHVTLKPLLLFVLWNAARPQQLPTVEQRQCKALPSHRTLFKLQLPWNAARHQERVDCSVKITSLTR